MKLPLEATNKPIWMVRAGRGAAYIDDFIESGFVGIGFPGAGELASPIEKDAVIRRMQNDQPDKKFQMAASQIKRFYDEFKQGDLVLTYDPGQRLYFFGQIKSDVQVTSHLLFRSRQVEHGHSIRKRFTPCMFPSVD